MTEDEIRKSLIFVCEERERLQEELQRKDNIIKEIKEYINNKTQHYFDDNIYFKETCELLLNEDELNEILDIIEEAENDN